MEGPPGVLCCGLYRAGFWMSSGAGNMAPLFATAGPFPQCCCNVDGVRTPFQSARPRGIEPAIALREPAVRDLDIEHMRILLVEDEAEMAAALSQALKGYDMVVDHVPSLA